jgi:hydrogenase maturation protein HypF
MPEPARNTTMATRSWRLGGRIQGVGFRPFVHGLAQRLHVNGIVRNRSGTVEILAGADPATLSAFEHALLTEAPPPARPRLIDVRDAAVELPSGFVIGDSEEDAQCGGVAPPDQSLCTACRAELTDPANRRYRYPFTTCSHCGPRYSMIRALPYDRARTTMDGFPLCPACLAEYRDPGNRRFHAQGLACPDCGPRVTFTDRSCITVEAEDALRAAVALLRDGGIVAARGIGGYHLLCDACNPQVIMRLRRDKPRPDKPFAVMFPVDDGLAMLRAHVLLDSVHESALRDPAYPIVVARVHPRHGLADNIAPGLVEIGVMLPYSPLHELLLDDFGGPLVASSANPRGEPVLIGAGEAEACLSGIADGFLHHDRTILRPADDPVRRVIAGRARPLRIGRGDAPLELTLPFTVTEPLLAVGGHMKNTVALAFDNRVLVSPHVGAPDSPRGFALFTQTIESLQSLHRIHARRVVSDAHPAYASHAWARACGLPVIEVFHHRAHASIVAGEFARPEPWLIFTWDGIGYGEDGTLWGGEALLGTAGRWRRVASLRPFRIPGGQRAGREPWRSALALCLEQGRDWPDRPPDADLFAHAWRRGLNCTTTSSAGRLFDAAAALCGFTLAASYEGQGPMRLEAAAQDLPTADEQVSLPLTRDEYGLWRSDWAPLVDLLLDAGRSPAERAARFHDALAVVLRDQARALREHYGSFTIGLSGGVFQNRRLTEAAMRLLAGDGFEVRLPATVPYNDAGLCYGQIVEGALVAGLAVTDHRCRT